MSAVPSGGSFRDPSGFVFSRFGVLLRQVQEVYRADYDQLLGSGLYEELAEKGLLVKHGEESLEAALTSGAYRVIKPEPVPFVSYPYEWCFSQLREGALLTLEIQQRALNRGMSLKDASAFNVQFIGSRPIFVDTLSFESYREGRPWVAYGQFCRHFLAPLLLTSRADVRLTRLLSVYLDGVPLDLASSLMPLSTWFRPMSLIHIHLQARAIRKFADAEVPRVAASRGVSRRGIQGILEHLKGGIEGLSWRGKTEWAGYGLDHAYDPVAFEQKQTLIRQMIEGVAPNVVWDLGSNTGVFSRLGEESGARVVAMDADPGAVERHYQDVKGRRCSQVLPLWMDLSNPSAAVGWQHEERLSLQQRGPADMVLVLALIHHLAISNNVPLPLLSKWIAAMARFAVVEFVPKSDPQVGRLLRTREDIFQDYCQESFEAAFRERFEVLRCCPIPRSQRTLYLLRAVNGKADA